MPFKHCPDFQLLSDDQLNEPLIIYTIVRTSLAMGSGKIAGQCQHAMQYLIQYYNSEKYQGFPEIRFEKWINSDLHTKVVLSASDKEWDKLMEEYDFIEVIDAGKTEIAAGSKTVGILYPMFKSERSKTLKRLQLLK